MRAIRRQGQENATHVNVVGVAELLVYRKSTTLLQTFKQLRRRRIVSAGTRACGLRFYYCAEQAPFADGFVNLSLLVQRRASLNLEEKQRVLLSAYLVHNRMRYGKK